MNEILEKLKNVNSNFFTVDIAKRCDRKWIIMKLGDGQVSGLQDYDAERFYKELIAYL